MATTAHKNPIWSATTTKAAISAAVNERRPTKSTPQANAFAKRSRTAVSAGWACLDPAKANVARQ